MILGSRHSSAAAAKQEFHAEFTVTAQILAVR